MAGATTIKSSSNQTIKTNKEMRYYFLFFLFISTVAYGQMEDLYKPIKNNQPKERICFALYTVHENTLKLTAQFYPIRNSEPFEAILEMEKEGAWIPIDTTHIIYPGYTAPFRVENWDDTQAIKYRVNHNNTAFYEGVIQKNPINQEEFVMATFSCNSIYPSHGGDISRQDIIDNITQLQPDLLFFSGDQVYDHSQHYLHWLKFGRDFGPIIRNTPTICITDDHDIGHPNLWGEGGKKATERRGHLGGYYMPASYVNEVERAQTSHLPDPYDPTPIEQGIGVYYTHLNWGGISFAILEDRKFKSGLSEVAAFNPDIFPDGPFEALFDPTVDTRKLDIEGTTLLGERQLKFLEDWTTNWKNAEMKSVLSQTIFALVNNYTGRYGQEIYADFDTNGWPQSGRNKALATIRKSFSCMIAGDQHLGTVLQHGIEDWGDAGYSFATPAIANLWPRWWFPSQKGQNRKPNSPDYTGDYLDGFKNKMTVLAAANPTKEEQAEGGKLNTRAAGYGIVRYHKPNRTITFECWARNVNIHEPDARPYEGWPITIHQTDNFQIKDGYQLPTLILSKKNQVVTIKNQYNKEVVSSLRIKGTTYQPKVLHEGYYTIEIGEGATKKSFRDIKAVKKNKEKLATKL